MRNINLPSVNIVERFAFAGCEALTDVKFGDKLETIGGRAFGNCRSLERITLPLKYDMIEDDDDDDDYYKDVFQGCDNLRHVDLLGGVHEFVADLPLDEWKNDMSNHRHIHLKSTQFLFGLMERQCICRSHAKRFHLLSFDL